MSNQHNFLSKSCSTISKAPLYKNISVLFTVTILSLLFGCCQTKETTLISSLKNKNDKILFRILQETNYLLKSNKKIHYQNFQCFSIIKNDLAKNKLKTYKQIDYSINFYQSMILQNTYDQEKISPRGQINQILYHRLDKILDMLQGKCLTFRTITFITEYCHKVHVRQLDDEHTKYYNQKPLYQDFNIGLFIQERKIKFEKHKQLPQSKPKLSNLSAQFHHLYVEGLYQKDEQQGKLEIEIHKDGKIAFSSAPIAMNSNYLKIRPEFLQMQCKDVNGKVIEKIKGLIVSPYEVLLTQKNFKCPKFTQFRNVYQAQSLYEHPQQIRVYKSFLYGNVEEICTAQWNWKRKGQDFEYKQLKKGNILFVQFFDSMEKKLRYHFVTIKKVYHSGLVELEEEIGSSFSFIDTTFKQYEKVSNLTACQLLFDKPISRQSTQNNKYVGNNVMKLNPLIIKDNQMTKLGCICNINIKNEKSYLFGMEVSVGKRIGADYYKVYYKINRDVYLFEKIKQNIFASCYSIHCAQFTEKATEEQESDKNGFTSLRKLNRNNPINITEEMMDEVLILDILHGGLIRLKTIDSSGNVYYYLLTEGQLRKIRQFENGTKQIEKQNQFYQNITSVQESEQFSQYLYIYCSKLPNGTFYGGIWKMHDFVFFPRFRLIDEKIVSLEARSGFAYLRQINPNKMEDTKSLAIFNYIDLLKEHFLWETESHSEEKDEKKQQNIETEDKTDQKEEKISSNKRFFLNDSYSINYTYTHGDFCGPPIKKNRQTLVTIRCGKAWMKITQVRQTSPCKYWIEVQTLLLCQDNFKHFVQHDISIPTKDKMDKINFEGVTCLKEDVFDEAPPFYVPSLSMKDMIQSAE